MKHILDALEEHLSELDDYAFNHNIEDDVFQHTVIIDDALVELRKLYKRLRDVE